jgi:hypothetical protein
VLHINSAIVADDSRNASTAGSAGLRFANYRAVIITEFRAIFRAVEDNPETITGFANQFKSGALVWLSFRSGKLGFVIVASKQSRQAEYEAGGFATVGPDGDNFRCSHAIAFA